MFLLNCWEQWDHNSLSWLFALAFSYSIVIFRKGVKAIFCAIVAHFAVITSKLAFTSSDQFRLCKCEEQTALYSLALFPALLGSAQGSSSGVFSSDVSGTVLLHLTSLAFPSQYHLPACTPWLRRPSGHLHTFCKQCLVSLLPEFHQHFDSFFNRCRPHKVVWEK